MEDKIKQLQTDLEEAIKLVRDIVDNANGALNGSTRIQAFLDKYKEIS